LAALAANFYHGCGPSPPRIDDTPPESASAYGSRLTDSLANVEKRIRVPATLVAINTSLHQPVEIGVDLRQIYPDPTSSIPFHSKSSKILAISFGKLTQVLPNFGVLTFDVAIQKLLEEHPKVFNPNTR
jgi:hypothetical protein